MKNEEVVKKIVPTDFPQIYNFCSDIIPFICHFMYNNFRLASFNSSFRFSKNCINVGNIFISDSFDYEFMIFLLRSFNCVCLYFPIRPSY